MPTESFFSQSSLAYIASAGAGKDGKAYSIKPIDGTGDFTFSRGSNLAATRVGADGLIEKGRENLLTYSNQFDTTWISSGTTEASGQSGYDGFNDAWLLSASSANNFLYRNDVTSFSGVNTISLYAKKGTADGVRLRFNQATDANIYINLINGSDAASASGVISHNVTSLTNGWYRIEMTFSVSSPVDFRIYPTNTSGGAVAGNIFIQDSQAEIGLAATEYIETTTTTGTAGILEDTPRFDYSNGASCPSLLLEGSRTNSLSFSEYLGGTYWLKYQCSIATNQGVSPDGTNTSSLLTSTVAGTGVLYRTGVSTGSCSIFAKANNMNSSRFTIQVDGVGSANWNQNGTLHSVNGGTAVDGEDYGNGWFRFTYNVTSGSVFNTGISSGAIGDSILIWGLQNESNASYPTSYIPNHSGGTITRAADACSKTGISSLIGQTEGVLYWEGENIGDDFAPYLGLFADAPNANSTRVMVYYLSQTTIQVQVRLSGVVQFLSAAATVSGKTKVAIGYRENDFVLYVNGVKISESSSGSTFTNQLTTFNFNSAICKSEQILIFKTRLSNADLATLTTI